jgi:hypothetical protein
MKAVSLSRKKTDDRSFEEFTRPTAVNLSVDDGKAVEKSKQVSNPPKKRWEPPGN